MKIAGTLCVSSAALLGFLVYAAAQSELPPGPNRDVVARECQTCHGLQLISGRGKMDLGKWVALIERMEDNGLSVSPDDRAKILEYLTTALGNAEPAT